MCETNTLNLFDLFTSSRKKRIEEVDFSDKSMNFVHESYDIINKSKVCLNFESYEVGKIRLKGNFSVILQIPCDRCLEDVAVPIELEFEQELIAEDKQTEEEHDEMCSFLIGNEFDVNEFVKLNVLMNMPSKVLCHDDCKGLCPVCGNNLNDHECGCDSFVPDPRMARIKDIFLEANKEV